MKKIIGLALGQQGWAGRALGRPATVWVEGLAHVALRPTIEQGVGGPSVKAHEALGNQAALGGLIAARPTILCGCPNLKAADVGNATEVEHRHGACQGRRLPRLADHGRMKGWHQRCALSARGNVSVSKVEGHGNACALGQSGCMQQLQAVALGGCVTNGLAMDAEGGDGRRREAGAAQEVSHQVCHGI